MKKKQVILLFTMISMLSLGGCGTKSQETENAASNQLQSQENMLTENDTDTKDVTVTEGVTTEDDGAVADNSTAGDDGATRDNSTATENTTATNNSAVTGSVSASKGSGATKTSESIQDEISKVESASVGYENADWGSMGQQEMNQLTAQWYKLWDDELNSLWSRLSAELDKDTKAKVLEEQRTWIKEKEEKVKAAGAEAEGGSLQPQLENSAAQELTRERVYVLAGYLAKARGEAFAISPEAQKSTQVAEASLEEVFEKFQGKWMFDKERDACVGVEKTAACQYGVPGSNWTVWVTGGDIMSDLNVYSYTSDTIVFKLEQGDLDAYYKLAFNADNAVTLAYGMSLDAMDDVIVCE